MLCVMLHLSMKVVLLLQHVATLLVLEAQCITHGKHHWGGGAKSCLLFSVLLRHIYLA